MDRPRFSRSVGGWPPGKEFTWCSESTGPGTMGGMTGNGNPAEHASALRALAIGSDRHAARRSVADLTEKLITRTGRGLQLSDSDLGGLDLSGFDLRSAQLSRAVLHGTKLVGADLSDAVMICPGMERTDLTRAVLRQAYVHALAAQTCRFDHADLTGLRDATGSLWHGCSMRGVRLSGAHLAGATFYQCDLSESDLSAAALQGAVVNECTLRHATLGRSQVSQFTVTKSSLTCADLSGAAGEGVVLQRLTDSDGLVLAGATLPTLRLHEIRGVGWRGAGLAAPGADLAHVTLEGADLAAADLSEASIVRCALPGATLTGASLIGARVYRSSMAGAVMTDVQAENLHVVESSLRSATMNGFVGRCTVMRDCDLRGADLSHSNLYRAMITGDPPSGMTMAEVDLSGAILVQAYVAADLTGAVLRGVNAAYSRFSQSDLRGADLTGAAMYQSTWVKVKCEAMKASALTGPFFVDRCPGLLEALTDAGDGVDTGLVRWITGLDELLAGQRKGST